MGANTIPTTSPAGVTLVGLSYYGIPGCGSGSCAYDHSTYYVDNFNFTTATTGNLASEILGIQFWANGVMVYTGAYNPAGMSVNLVPHVDRNGPFQLEFILSPIAAGTVQCTLTGGSGILSIDIYGQQKLPIIGPVITVGSLPTPTPSPTP